MLLKNKVNFITCQVNYLGKQSKEEVVTYIVKSFKNYDDGIAHFQQTPNGVAIEISKLSEQVIDWIFDYIYDHLFLIESSDTI